MVPGSDSELPKSIPSDLIESWDQTVEKHFEGARERVEPIYLEHFASLGNVYRRHWRNRRDIPTDLLNLPRGLWRLSKRSLGMKSYANSSARSLKDTELARLLERDLLQLDQLNGKLWLQLQNLMTQDSEQWRQLELLLRPYSPEKASHMLTDAVQRLTLTHEGGRDFLLFVSMGLIGRGLSDKIGFAGAMTLGSAAASSIYLSQQGVLGSLWAGWFGVPGWVGITGASAGFGLVLLATPIISPITEYGVNRVRAKKLLHQTIDQTEEQLLMPSEKDLLSVVGQMGTYVQLLPDLIHILKQLR